MLHSASVFVTGLESKHTDGVHYLMGTLVLSQKKAALKEIPNVLKVQKNISRAKKPSVYVAFCQQESN